jgi:hydrogenase maturation protease
MFGAYGGSKFYRIKMLKVIALGNTLRGDDGVGPAVIDTLTGMEAPEMILIDLGSNAFDLLFHLNRPEPIVLIDCAQMGIEPGGIRRMTVDAKILQHVDRFISLHGFSFSEIYGMAAGIGTTAPCRLIAIEPDSVEFGSGLSPVVRESIPSVVRMIFEEMHIYEEKNNYH